jgi:PPE-repeat protein
LGYAVHYDPDGAGKLDAILARLGAVLEGSGTSALASLGSAEVDAGSGAAPVLSAGLGRASSIGALSVPPGWAAATPPIRLVAAAWPDTLSGFNPTVLAASPENLLNEPLLASTALRGVGGGATQGRPTVIKTVRPRPRDADDWR